MVVERPFGVNQDAAAQLAGMLVKSRLEIDFAELAAGSQSGASRSISAMIAARLEIGRAEQLERRVVPLPSLSVVPSSITVPA